MHNSSNALNIKFPSRYFRVPRIAQNVSVLTDIYQEEVNIAVWNNQLSDQVIKNITCLMQEPSYLNVVIATTPESINNSIIECAPELSDKKALCEYIALLVDIFCTLFELRAVGLRLTTLDTAMCPKFHVDKVPCRLVTTFSGIATEWLPDHNVERAKLGAGSKGAPDETSGLMKTSQDIQRLAIGDVALLKGEGWYNNENGGAIHRSPAIKNNDKRLLLTLDFMDE